MHDLHFDAPAAAYLLLGVLALAALFWWQWRSRQKNLQKLGSFEVLRTITIQRSPRIELLRALAICIAWISAVTALMQPLGAPRYLDEDGEAEQGDILAEELIEEAEKGEEVPSQPVRRRKAHEVIFLLDTSASMDVKDTRTGSTRLDYAKEVIDEVVSELDGHTIALYAFTSQVTTVVPSTVDYLYARLALKFVGINEGDIAGTDLVEALEFIRRRHFKANKDKILTLILLTDGGDTRLETLSGDSRTREVKTILSRLKGAETLNLRTFTVGVGSAQGALIPDIEFEGQPVRSSLDEELLAQLAEQGRGRYYFANQVSTLGIAQSILKEMRQDEEFVTDEESTSELLGTVERTQERSQDSQLLYDLYFQYPLASALFFLLIALGLPETSQKQGEA